MSNKSYLSAQQKQKFLEREEMYCRTLETDKRHEKLFAPFGISFTVYRVLTYLLTHDGVAAPSQMADELVILRTNMTNLLNSLEKNGMVERTMDPEDRRRVTVQLLPAGEELALKVFEEESRYGMRIAAHISEEESREYHRLERRMYEAKVAALNDILSEREG